MPYFVAGQPYRAPGPGGKIDACPTACQSPTAGWSTRSTGLWPATPTVMNFMPGGLIAAAATIHPMHRRDAFDPESRRLMHRTQIKGDRPFFDPATVGA